MHCHLAAPSGITRSGEEGFSSLCHRVWDLPGLLSNGYKVLFPWGLSGWGAKLTTHLHLVPRSKNAWSYTSTPQVRLHGMVLS